jgi:cysteine desulfurase/selenocysteine lyase
MKAIKLYGDKNISSPIISFSVEGSHPHDIATVVDNYGVAIRAGHHCAQPLMNFLGVTSTARASIGMYTSKEDIDNLIISLEKAIKIFN